MEAFRIASCLSLGLIPSFHCTEKKICSVTREVKGRPGSAILLNGDLILSVAEESTQAGWRIMELIFSAWPEGPSALPAAWEPQHGQGSWLLKVQSAKQLGFHVSTLLCKSFALCQACCYPTGEAISLAFLFFPSGDRPVPAVCSWPEAQHGGWVPIRRFTHVLRGCCGKCCRQLNPAQACKAASCIVLSGVIKAGKQRNIPCCS